MRLILSGIVLAGVAAVALPAMAEESDGERQRPGPEMKQKVLDIFDTNGDGELNQAERQRLRRVVHAIVAPSGREGRGPDARRGPEGQGPKGRRGSHAKRGDRDPRGPAAERPRRGQADGPPQGRKGPGPERLFNRFDEDQSGSLSRQEFKQLTEKMRQRHRDGRGQGQRGDRGPRRPPAPPAERPTPDDAL